MNQQAKTKREFPYVTLILVVTLVLVVAILGYTLVDAIGIIGRLDNAAKSDHIKLNENHVSVYRGNAYQSAYQQYYYEYMYYMYGIQQDIYGVTKMYSTPDQYAAAMMSYYRGALEANAYNSAEMCLAYCEGAMDRGVYEQLKEETKAELDEYMEGLKTSAKDQGVLLATLLKNNYGNGVSEKEVRTAMEYYFIALKFSENLQKEYADGATAEEIEKYLGDNKSSFYTTQYTYYKLVNEELKTKYKIDECKTAEEVKKVIVQYFVDTKFDTLYKTYITDKKIEDTAGAEKTKADVLTTILVLKDLADKDTKAVFTDKDTDAYKKAAYTICNNIVTSANTELNKVKETTAKWADPKGEKATELQKWLFGDGRKEGDVKLLETKTTSKDSTTGKDVTKTEYTWYVVGKDVMKLDTELTKNAYYIMLSDDGKDVENGKTAAQKAEAFYNELKDAKTAEKFAELVEKYAPGYTGDLIERISYDSIKGTNEDLAKWLYEEGRNKGDITNIVVKGDSKDKEKVTAHIIAMFEDENEETWKLNCRDAIAAEKLDVWFEDAVEKYHVEIDYEPETTAATTTKAPETTAKTPETTAEPSTEASTEAGTEATTEASTEADAE